MSTMRQLPLLLTPRAAARACFFDLAGGKRRAKFSALTPKAMIMFSERHGIPIVSDPKDLEAFDLVFFSLHCFRDFYKVADVAQYKRKGQEWIAGGNAAATPTGVSWIMDYVWIGDCNESFPLLLRGERHLPGLLDMRHPNRAVRYVDEDISAIPLNDSEIEMSKGCPRKCLFCIHPWRHRYQEQPQPVVEAFLRTRKGKGVGLVSNSSDDVTYYEDLAGLLEELGKTDMVVSNAVQGLSEGVVSRRKREMLLGVEGMSERLRWIINKPIPRTTLRDKIELCLRYGRQIRTVYQFNLPGERADDFEELREDVEHFRRTVKKGSWAIPFIPNQPSAHTPLQWCVPHYSWEMFDRIQAFRTSLFGSKNTGIAFYVPAPLGGSKWFAQQIAEWIPITPEVARVVQKIPMRLTVEQMVAFLASEGVRLPDAFLRRDAATVFPWSNIITTGDDADKWGRYAYMVRKMATPRGQGLPADIAPAESAA